MGSSSACFCHSKMEFPHKTSFFKLNHDYGRTAKLVGSFKSFEKYARQIGSFPQTFRGKIKHIWNHQLVNLWNDFFHFKVFQFHFFLGLFRIQSRTIGASAKFPSLSYMRIHRGSLKCFQKSSPQKRKQKSQGVFPTKTSSSQNLHKHLGKWYLKNCFFISSWLLLF